MTTINTQQIINNKMLSLVVYHLQQDKRRKVSPHRVFYTMTGNHIAALVLRDVIHWWALKLQRGGTAFYRSDAEWREVCGFSESNMTTARQYLAGAGVVCEVKMARGSRTWHYSIDVDAFLKAFVAALGVTLDAVRTAIERIRAARQAKQAEKESTQNHSPKSQECTPPNLRNAPIENSGMHSPESGQSNQTLLSDSFGSDSISDSESDAPGAGMIDDTPSEITPEVKNWQTALATIAQDYDPQVYSQWLADTRFIRCEEKEMYVIGVRNSYAVDLLTNCHMSAIERFLSAACGSKHWVKFEVDASLPPTIPLFRILNLTAPGGDGGGRGVLRDLYAQHIGDVAAHADSIDGLEAMYSAADIEMTFKRCIRERDERAGTDKAISNFWRYFERSLSKCKTVSVGGGAL